MKMNAILSAANPKHSRERKRNGVSPPVRAEEPTEWGPTLEVLRVRITLEDEGLQPRPPGMEKERPTPDLRVSRRVRNGQPLKPVRTPVAIFESLWVCIYVPASRHWLISYSPIHLT